MVKSPSKKLVREIVGGESYEYYPLGQHIVVAPGVWGVGRRSNIGGLTSVMRWVSWRRDVRWSRLRTAMTFQSRPCKNRCSWQLKCSTDREKNWRDGDDSPR